MDELTKAFPNVPELWEGAADGAWRHEGKRPKRPCRGGHHLRRVPICRRNAPRQKIAGGIARNQTAASELTFVAPRGPFMRSIFQAARSAAGWLSHANFAVRTSGKGSADRTHRWLLRFIRNGRERKILLAG
jgi:hypothetical protein